MKSIQSSSLLAKLQKIRPVTNPLSYEQLIEFRNQDAIAFSQKIDTDYQANQVQKLWGASGINKHFLKCSFDNYQVENEGQLNALNKAKNYAEKFDAYSALAKGFLFSGTCGTGKNHLASAIANHLMRQGKTVVLLNVMDILGRAKETYKNRELTEDRLFKEFCRPDLLIIDEIGMQRGTQDEKLWLTRIIDKRLYAEKPTGFITNLKDCELKILLDERNFERMKEGIGMTVSFKWQSFREREIA